MLTILILVTAVTVGGVIFEIIRQQRCLTPAEFERFRNGRLRSNEKQYRRAVSHLGICRKCQRKLEELNFGRGIEEHLVE